MIGAGRRFGKSYLARVQLLVEALKMENDEGYDISDTSVYYIAPTFNQAKDIMWQSLKTMAAPFTKKVRENECILTLVNDRQIHLKGSDRPDTLRGVGLSYVVMDEYAFMKEEVWTAIIRPVLADVRGGAMFIGTPDGKNHFYDLFVQAERGGDNGQWAAWTFSSVQNPLLDPAEIASATKDMPLEYVKQEFEANFSSFGGTVFKSDMIHEANRDHDFEGEIFMTVDPAGYSDTTNLTKGQTKRLDETAISIVKTGTEGWYVMDIVTGRWDVRETAIKILRLAQVYKPVAVGIEKGALKQALMPYLQDNMRRLNTYPPIQEVSHNNQKKQDRIVWALQGRMEQGRLIFKPGEYLEKVKNQLLDFPNPMTHDDMIDSLAYIDQISHTQYGMSLDDYGSISNGLDADRVGNVHPATLGDTFINGETSAWQPMDTLSGF
mgnify:CR=1 FL=1